MSELPNAAAEPASPTLSEKDIKKLRRKALKKRLKRKAMYKNVDEHLARRYRKEKIFKTIGATSIGFCLGLLVLLSVVLIFRGAGAMTAHYITLDAAHFTASANYSPLAALNEAGGRAPSRAAKRDAYLMLESRAIRRDVKAELDAGATDIRFKLSSEADVFLKNDGAEEGRMTEQQQAMLAQFDKEGRVSRGFNAEFWREGDSNYPEYSGILAGLVGLAMVIAVSMSIALPAGVATAVYLEEFAPKNVIADMIEININNLAAVPSIIFGLLGLSLYIGVFGTPRSSAIAGGLTLAMMALPVIVIATRGALRSVPASVRDGALALGATRMQTTLHHVLPLAMPGMITGLVLGIARVIGETAPLLMVGMAAFILTPPGSFTDPATTLPVQIYMWADRPEIGFQQTVSAAIAFLLALLFLINSVANYFRVKYRVLR